MFIGTLLLENKEGFDIYAVFAMHFPSGPEFRPWQLITHMFMHGGLAHLAFNMIGLVTIGSTLEHFMGSKRFLQLFFYSGLGAISLHILIEAYRLHDISGLWFPAWDSLGLKIDGEQIFTNGQYIKTKEDIGLAYRIFNSPLVGASGALYGIIVAFAFMFPNTELMFMLIPYPIKAKYLIPGIIALDMFLGLSNYQWDPVAHFAHLGGAATGLALVYFWRKKDRRNFW